MGDLLPDWGARQNEETALVYAGFEAGNVRFALPDRLEVATEADGAPAFRMIGVRPAAPSTENPAYSRLDMRLRPHTPRAPEGGAPWRQCRIARGFLRFRMSEAFGALPAELTTPFSFDVNSLSTAQFSMKLSPEAASLIEAALARDSLPLLALAEIEIDGVSPRLPARVRLLARKAMTILRDAAMNGVVMRAALGQMLLTKAASAIEIDGVARDHPDLADALADRFRVRFGRPVPSPFTDASPALAAPADGIDAPDSVSWDLSQTLVAPRPLALGFDPFAQARALLRAASPDTLVTRIVTPALSPGFHRIAICSNAPTEVAGVAMLGARLRFPARPPFRAHEDRKSIDLSKNRNPFVDVRLGPGEPIEWLLRSVVVLQGDRGVETLESPEQAGVGLFAFVAASTFPARFVECELGAALAEIAHLDVVVAAQRASGPYRATLRIDSDKRRGYIALPFDALDANIVVSALPKAGGEAITLEPRAADDLFIDLPMLPGFGARSVLVDAVFDDGQNLLAIEVAPSPNRHGPRFSLFPRTSRRAGWSGFARIPSPPAGAGVGARALMKPS